MKNRLVWKLLFTNIVPVIIVIILVIWLAIDNLAAEYFMDLMENYSISPTEIHDMFLTSIHHYLLWASLVALFTAAVLSFLLTRRVLKPLSQMSAITEKYASGDFSARVRVSTTDEVGELGKAFNRMADSLEQIERLRKNMVADAAHELRTPLTNLCGYLEALRDGVLPSTDETLKILHQESLHLKSLIEGLQQLARADAAKGYLHRTMISPAKEMEQVERLYRHRFDQKEIKVATSLTATREVPADRDKILQVLRNLFENCLNYTPRGGWVEFKVNDRNGCVRFEFSNSGQGITKEDLPFIFERFFRTDRSRSREAGGFGLGLAITKQLVEAHEGKVGAESERGTTKVWFELPA